MNAHFGKRLLVILPALAVAIWLTRPDTQADEAAPAAKQQDPRLTPPDGGVQDLLNFMRKLARMRPKGETRDELIADYQKIQRAMVVTSDKLLAASADDTEDGTQVAAAAIQMKLGALQLLRQLGDEQAGKDLQSFVDRLVADKRAAIAEMGRSVALQLKYEVPSDADEATAQKLADELKADFGKGEVSPQAAQLIMQVVMGLEQLQLNDVAADLCDVFGKRLSESDDPRLAELGQRLAGTGRRLNLPGHPIKVTGTLLGGGDIDWSDYKGKVVLVDFWATWCAPCVQELPNVLENYNKYHDKGFDVLGVSLDNSRGAVERFVQSHKLPWKTLFSGGDSIGWQHPMAVYYGIAAIPTVILVNQEGNVVSLNARGPELSRLLTELLGPPDDKPKEEEG